MANYKTILEETAEMLAKKQLGLDPKRKDVEQDDNLPEMLVSVKKTFFDTLENSFKKVCATIQEKSGVKDLSDDTMLMIANKINEEAEHGNLESITDLSKNEQIVAVAEKAVVKQKEIAEYAAHIDGEGSMQEEQDVTTALIFGKGIDELNESAKKIFDDWSNIGFKKAQETANEYLDSDEYKRRNAEIYNKLVNAYANAKTPEERNRIANAVLAHNAISGDILKFQAKGIQNGNSNPIVGILLNLGRQIVFDEEVSADEIITSVKATLIANLDEDKAEQVVDFLQKIEKEPDRDGMLDKIMEISNGILESKGQKPLAREAFTKQHSSGRTEKFLEKITELPLEQQKNACYNYNQAYELFGEYRAAQNILETPGKKMKDSRVDDLEGTIAQFKNIGISALGENLLEMVKTTALRDNDQRFMGLYNKFSRQEKSSRAVTKKEEPEVAEVKVVRTAPAVKTMDDEDDRSL